MGEGKKLLPNIVRDEQNSSRAILPAFGVFAGQFVDVTNYASISITIESDVGAQFPGIEVQWSVDGQISHQSQLFSYTGPFFDGAGTLSGVTFYVPVRMKFYRVIYTNDFQPQTFFSLECLLRQNTVPGTTQQVMPGQVFSTLTQEAQMVTGVLVAQDYFNTQFVMPYATTDGLPLGGAYLIVDKPIASDFVRSTITPASLTAVPLDQGFGQSGRRFASVFNDSKNAILFIKLGANPTLTDWHYKLPPQTLWQFPQAWGMCSAAVFGIWDKLETDNRSVYVEGTN